MGQKAKGHHRNVPYGLETVKKGGKDYNGWEYKVYPQGCVGWSTMLLDTHDATYGANERSAGKVVRYLEETRLSAGYLSSGRGVKWSEKGCEVYGEYMPMSGRRNKVQDRNRKTRRDRALVRLYMERGVRVTRNRVNLLRVVRRDRSMWRELKKIETQTRGMRKRKKILSSKQFAHRGMVASVVRCGTIALEKLLAKFVARALMEGREHKKVLREFEAMMKIQSKQSVRGLKNLGMGKQQTRGYYGVRLVVNGRLDGGRRTAKYTWQIGKVPMGLMSGRIRTGEAVAKTKDGTLGVRLTFCYGRG